MSTIVDSSVNFMHVEYPVRQKDGDDSGLFYHLQAKAQKRLEELLARAWRITESNVIEDERAISILYALVRE